VNYRAYVELIGCLDSVQPFLGNDLEVVLVDHASDRVEAARVSAGFPWVRTIAVGDNPGFAAGVNRAARAATGEYLLLLNPDCLLETDVARALASWLDDHPTAGACGALVRESDGSVQASARRFPNLTTGFAGRTSWLTRLWPENRWTRQNLVARSRTETAMQVDWVSGACMMVRRQAFEAVGGMDEQFFLYWEDADLCFRLKRAGWLTFYNPLVVVTHLTGRSSAQARSESLAAFHRSAYLYFVKHGGWFARSVSPLVFLALQARRFLKLALQTMKGPGARGVSSNKRHV
jgi:GT2 family glycosyltransferase